MFRGGSTNGKALRISTVILLSVFTTALEATTIAVNTTDDELNTDGDCSLREAIRAANLNMPVDACPAGSGHDQIIVPAGVYTLTIVGDDATGVAGDLDITEILTIAGDGADTTIIQACAVHQKAAPCPAGQGVNDRILDVRPRATLSIAGLTIRHGRPVRVGIGGGIRVVSGTLNLADTVVRDNIAHTGGGLAESRGIQAPAPIVVVTRATITGNVATNAGGGLYNRSGTLTIAQSAITDNVSGGRSGGIEVAFGGILTLTDSTVAGNRAGSSSGGIGTIGNTTEVHLTRSTVSGNESTSGGGITSLGLTTLIDTTISANRANTGSGGGILHAGASFSTLTVTGSTISGNTARAGGGIASQAGATVLTNSTISGNQATAGGGGLFASGFAVVALNNVTITANVADADSGGDVTGIGGGILRAAHTSASVSLTNSILAGNVDGAPDCSGMVVSNGFNLIGTLAGCGLVPTGSDLTDRDPRLGPLADNGGPTLTHALLAGSPAIDAGSPAVPGSGTGACEPTDQRGVARPVGVGCDIGAIEGTLEALTILTGSPLFAQLGVFSLHSLDAIGGAPPYSWSLLHGMLPAGMEFGVDGVLRGTPTEIGRFEFTASVMDSAVATAERVFVVEVRLTAPPPQIRITKVGTVPVPGRVVSYFILLRNAGNRVAEGLHVVEFLDPWFAFIDADPAPTHADDVTVLWEPPALAPGDFRVISYRVRVDPAAPLGTLVRGEACASDRDLQLTDYAKCLGACRAGCEITLSPSVCAAACNVEACGTIKRADEVIAMADCSSADSSTSGPLDPNEKGVIARRFIQPDELLVYPIHFENIGDIEALDVFVTDVLDPGLDASSVASLTPGGSFDATTRTMRWDLLGINLPPQAGDNVLFAVQPLPDLPSGTTIRNRAAIQFEIFETITTNEVVNIIDTTPPMCVMDPLPGVSATSGFPISWSGSDAVGEIESFTILVSVDGGGFTPFLNPTTGTSTVFNGEAGLTYGFICVATDTAGNIEDQSLLAEAVTRVTIRGDLDHDGDVDRDDLAILLADRNKTVEDARCGAPCDLDDDGTITALDARQLVGLCTRPRCATQ